MKKAIPTDVYDKDGNMVPPTAEQGKTYAGLYLAATAVAKK